MPVDDDKPRLRFDRLEVMLGEKIQIIAKVSDAREYVYVTIITEAIPQGRRYKLKETQKGSHIFTRKLLLTPKKRKIGRNELPAKWGSVIEAVLKHKEYAAKFRGLVVSITPEIVFDKEDYSPFDEMVIYLISPYHNMNPRKVEKVRIALKSPVSGERYFTFRETGSNTGIFEKKFRLTPDSTRLKGNLLVRPGDKITAEFQIDTDIVISKQVSIDFHKGIIGIDIDTLHPTQRAIVRVIDPDENRNPDVIDIVKVHVWSDTDKQGLNLALRETGDRTGIFEEIIEFTYNKESSGNRLLVSEGDTVTAEYIDKTLPTPATFKEDTLETVEYEKLVTSIIVGKPRREAVVKEKTLKIVYPTPPIIIVEGQTDKIFLERTIKKIFDVQFTTLGTRIITIDKDGQPSKVSGMVLREKGNIIVCRDYDNGIDIGKELEKFADQLQNIIHGNYEINADTIKFPSLDSTITLVTVGLKDDTDISSLNIKYHSLEDYLIKLAMIDDSVKQWCGISVQEIKNRMNLLKNILEKELKSNAYHKSKTLFTFITFFKGIAYEDAIVQIIDKVDRDALLSVSRELLGKIGMQVS